MNELQPYDPQHPEVFVQDFMAWLWRAPQSAPPSPPSEAYVIDPASDDLATVNAKVEAWLAQEEMDLP